MVGITVVGISMAVVMSVAISTILSISSWRGSSRPLAIVSMVGIGMGITIVAVVGQVSISIAVVGKAISVSMSVDTIVSISIGLSGGSSLSISRPLAIVSVVPM